LTALHRAIAKIPASVFRITTALDAKEPHLNVFVPKVLLSTSATNIKFMEKVFEIITDYFLRYSADVPADEIKLHAAFSRDCPCQPSVSFDDMNGWHTLVHQSIEDKLNGKI
jgi:hypothetical protein